MHLHWVVYIIGKSHLLWHKTILFLGLDLTHLVPLMTVTIFPWANMVRIDRSIIHFLEFSPN